MIDKEFIERAQELMKPAIIARIKQSTQYKKRHQKKYYATEHAKQKSRERNRIRNQAWKNLSDEEFEQTKEFYWNCPEGYVVDHIIPLSKGGKHTIDNLQYLTLEQNSSKGNKNKFNYVFA